MILEYLQKIVSTFQEFSAQTKGIFLFIASILLSFITRKILKIIAKNLLAISKRSPSRWDDFLLIHLAKIKIIVLSAWFFYFFIQFNKLGTLWVEKMDKIILLLTLWQLAIWVHAALRFWKNFYVERKTQENPSSSAALGLLYRVLQASSFTILFLLALSNLGVDIGALLAGLGVGGIAIALAAQNVLGDLLASLSIVLDRPFVVGDFIVLGEDKGTVEHIGIKTTRVRSLSGEELIFSNKDLLESRVRNFKRMWQRRVVHLIGVTYDTSEEKLKHIPQWIQEIIEGQEKFLRFDRCHFMELGAYSLNFELVFWVKDPEYNIFMDAQQRVLLAIYQKFAKEGVQFAFPTQTLHLDKNEEFKK